MSESSAHPGHRRRQRGVAPLVLVAVLALRVALVAAAPAAVLTDHGGRVLSSPQVSAIFLGDYWVTSQGANEAFPIDAFLQAWLAGPSVTDVLAQYRVTSAGFSSSDKVPGASPEQFTDADAQALVQEEIAARRGVAGDDTVHVIYLPPDTVLTFQGVTSLGRLGGYHSSYVDPATGNRVYYAVVVYNQGSNGIDLTGIPQDNATIVTSRVLAGAFTDPDVGVSTRGWLDDALGEVGDIAFALSQDRTLRDVFVLQNGFTVVLLWSNKDEKLTAGAATTPPATTPAPTATTTLSVTPATQTVAPGGTVIYTVTNPATAAGTLALAVSGLPTGVTGTFTATSLAPGATTTLTITAAADAPLTTATFTVTGTDGTTTDSATAAITVSTTAPQTPPAAPAADFSVTVTPTSQDVSRGGGVAVYTITTTQVGTGAARLKLKTQHVLGSLKAYLSTTRMTAGESATVSIRVHRNTRRKTYDFKLKVSSDTGDQLVPLTLTVR